MAPVICMKCRTIQDVGLVGQVAWCHDCYYDAHPEDRPKDLAASRRAWRARAAKGLPLFPEDDPAATVQAIGLLFRMRRGR